MAGPVQGPLVRAAGGQAAAAGTAAGVVLVVDDETTTVIPDVGAPVVALVCTAGEDGSPLASAAEQQQLPCVTGVRFDGGEPEAGTLLMVDCSGEVGVIRVVDGGVTEGALEDVVATQAPSGPR